MDEIQMAETMGELDTLIKEYANLRAYNYTGDAKEVMQRYQAPKYFGGIKNEKGGFAKYGN